MLSKCTIALVLLLSTVCNAHPVPCFRETCSIEFPQKFASEEKKSSFFKVIRESNCDLSVKQAEIIILLTLEENSKNEKEITMLRKLFRDKASTLDEYRIMLHFLIDRSRRYIRLLFSTDPMDIENKTFFKDKKCDTSETFKNFFRRYEKNNEYRYLLLSEFNEVLSESELSDYIRPDDF